MTSYPSRGPDALEWSAAHDARPNLTGRSRLRRLLNGFGAFPAHYNWLCLVAALDIAITTLVLELGGVEVNAIADRVLQSVGIPGLVLLKAASLAVILAVCEAIARTHRDTAVRVVQASIAVTCLPVILGWSQIAHLLITERDDRIWEAIIFQEDLPITGRQTSQQIHLRRSAYLEIVAREQALLDSAPAHPSAAIDAAGTPAGLDVVEHRDQAAALGTWDAHHSTLP